MFPSTSTGKTRKRFYRQRIKCEGCGKRMDSDYKEKHIQNVHKGRTVKFVADIEKSQQTLGAFFGKHSTKNVSGEDEGSDNEEDDINSERTTSPKDSFDTDDRKITKKNLVSYRSLAPLNLERVQLTKMMMMEKILSKNFQRSIPLKASQINLFWQNITQRNSAERVG